MSAVASLVDMVLVGCPSTPTMRSPGRRSAYDDGAFMTGTLTNVRSLTLDVSSPCFAPDLSRVETDTTVVVSFSDGRQPVTLTP